MRTLAFAALALMLAALPARAEGDDPLATLRALLLRHSGTLQAERAALSEAEAVLASEQGGFVPRLASSLTPARSGDVLAQPELRNELRWALPAGGGSLSLGSWLYPDPAIGEPGGVLAQWRQPLLRGARLAFFGGRLRLAELRRDASRLRYAARSQSELLALDLAYWDLALRRAMAEVSTEEVGRARANRDLVEARIKSHRAAEFERDEAEQAVLQFQGQEVESQQAVRAAEAAIATLVGARPSAEALRPQVPTTDIAPPFPLDGQALASRAREARADLAALRARHAEAVLAHEQASWDRAPELSLLVQADWNGAGSQARLFPRIDAQPGVAVGATFETTLGPSPENGAAAEARAREAAAAAELAQAAFAMEQEIALLVAEAQAAQSRARLSSLALAAAQRRYQVEQERFANGIVALPDLVRYHRALSQARLDELEARVQLLKTHAKLRRSVASDAPVTPLP